MEDLFNLIERTFYPEASSDIIITSIALFVFLLPSFIWAIIKFNKPKYYFSILPLLLLIYFFTINNVTPYFQNFSNDSFGVLILRNEVHELSDYFGDERFNDLLKNELNFKLDQFQKSREIDSLGDYIKFKPISWKANTQVEALKLMEKFNANAVLWGSITKLNNVAELNIYLELDTISFRTPLLKKYPIDIVKCIGPKFKLCFDPDIYNIEIFSQKILDNILPWSYIAISNNSPKLAHDIISKVWSTTSDTCTDFYSGLFIQCFAINLEREKDYKDAIEYYKLAYECFKDNLSKTSSSDTLFYGYNIKTYKAIIRRYAAEAKIKEAELARELNDANRELKSIKMAALIDSTKYEVLDSIIYDWYGLKIIDIDISEGTYYKYDDAK